jgi:cation diffusion facilitator CzcD-associated flavoprotein CzcO
MIAFIGAGPHNLAALAFLLQASPSLRSEVTVFDPTGTWLAQWDRQMAAQQIVHLRSSSVHHPDPDALALRRFAKGRFDEFYPPYYLPGTGLFREFCADVIERFEVASLVRPQKVVAVAPSGVGLNLTLDDGTVQYARAAVAALGGGDRVWPSWAPEPRPPFFVHSDQVDWDDLESATPGRLLVVGGGLTSGHLVLGALKRGWSVDLATRRPVKYKLFDAAPGWIGPKYLAGFLRETDWDRRRQMIAKARGGGAMTEEIRDLLAPFRRSGQLRFHPRWPVLTLGPVAVPGAPDRWRATSSWGRHLTADRVWLCTGTKLDLGRHPLFADVAARHPLQVVDGLPVLDAECRWPGVPLYFMGMSAALRVGPTARNFPGARQAASRIAKALTGVEVPPT